jgi:hypothetical protein
MKKSVILTSNPARRDCYVMRCCSTGVKQLLFTGDHPPALNPQFYSRPSIEEWQVQVSKPASSTYFIKGTLQCGSG